jgi:hypothetical protein
VAARGPKYELYWQAPKIESRIEQMSRERKPEEQWEIDEKAKLVLLRGDPRLEAIWNVAARRGEIGDLDGKIKWLKYFLRAASDEARLDSQIRALTELRRLYETDPTHPTLRKDVLWYYKWIAENMPEYSDIPLTTIEKIFDDMQGFYQAAREPLGPIYAIRCDAAITMGKKQEADDWFEKWQATPRSKLDDCAACTAARRIRYFLNCEREIEAIAAAEPILKGKAYCDETPAALTRLIGPLMRNEQRKLGTAILKVTGRFVRRKSVFLSAMATHVVSCFFVGNVRRARRLAIVSLHKAKGTKNDFHQFNLYRACGLWAAVSTMASVAGVDAKALPKNILPGMAETDAGKAELAEVAAVCLDAAKQIGARFDARNGTSRYCDGLRELEEAIRKMVQKMESSRRI